MVKPTAALVLAGISLLSLGCSDARRVTAAGPSSLEPSGSTSFARVQPSVLDPQLIGGGSCPAVEPFRALFNLMIQADADVHLLLTEVRLQFFGASGLTAPPVTLTAPQVTLPAPQVTLPAPVPTTQFGTALVDARATRTFPIDFRFGCKTGRRGAIVVVVHSRDGHGRHRAEELRVSVR